MCLRAVSQWALTQQVWDGTHTSALFLKLCRWFRRPGFRALLLHDLSTQTMHLDVPPDITHVPRAPKYADRCKFSHPGKPGLLGFKALHKGNPSVILRGFFLHENQANARVCPGLQLVLVWPIPMRYPPDTDLPIIWLDSYHQDLIICY